MKDFCRKDFISYYLKLMNLDSEHFSRNLQTHVNEINEVLADDYHSDNNYVDKVLLISSLVQMSNLYRSATETLVRDIASETKK